MSGKNQKTTTAVYGSQVAGIINGRPRDSDYRPENPLTLRLTNCRRPRSADELLPEERIQLQAILKDEYPTILENEDCSIEAAEVVDENGAVRFRLYGWNYGVGFLMTASGLELVAFSAQHDLEHWRPEQRPIFYAMDVALRAGGHSFQQALFFCWSDETCWEELDGQEPGTVGSEPYLRQQLRG